MTNEERTALENYARELSGREASNAEAGMNGVPALETVSAAELQRTDIPPLQWVVERILPQGLTILARLPNTANRGWRLTYARLLPLEGLSLAFKQLRQKSCIWRWRMATGGLKRV